LPLKGKILNVEKARFDKMLSSAEVGTLITALGCGIGRDEFDISRLRYHRIIIMTDADVDGSHIRTLLLTFFYRQMPELIANGHIYIAQPPLYKIKRGKQERYLKDDAEKEAYLIELALNNASLKLNPVADPLSEETLREIAQQYLVMNREKARLEKRYNPKILDAIRVLPLIEEKDLTNKNTMESWLEELRRSLLNFTGDGAKYMVEAFDAGGGEYGGKVVINTHGSESINLFAPDFFRSREYQHFISLETSHKLEDGVMQRGEKSTKVNSMKHAFDWLLAEAAQGLHLQRYKGLGEMNPSQLWETTMDINSRRMSQVRIEDAVAADEIFTTLMGDQVEPRREFIER
ncbi:MAG: toprim domain-containing protein, partial [Gammaproteobacteria bacterium]